MSNTERDGSLRPKAPSSIDEWRDPVRDLNWVSAVIGRA
jgi:hypothetical protein